MKEIETPEKIRKLQQVLHHNAKTNKTWRAWSLYANLLDEDVLAHGAAKVIANKGAAGIDGMSVSSIGSSEACSSSRRFAQSNNWLLARYRKWLWKSIKANTVIMDTSQMTNCTGLIGFIAYRRLQSIVHCGDSLGKPDAGNPHVRFDERGARNCQNSFSQFLLFDSTNYK